MMDLDMHPLYTQGYLKALLDLESLLTAIVEDCREKKIRFTPQKAAEFMHICQMHLAEMQHQAGDRYSGFVRVNAQKKEFEWFMPVKAKDVINTLVRFI